MAPAVNCDHPRPGAFYAREMSTVGERLRQLRESKGFSRRLVAADIGVSERSVVRWEDGSHGIDDDALAKLAKYYGEDVIWIKYGRRAQGAASEHPVPDPMDDPAWQQFLASPEARRAPPDVIERIRSERMHFLNGRSPALSTYLHLLAAEQSLEPVGPPPEHDMFAPSAKPAKKKAAKKR